MLTDAELTALKFELLHASPVKIRALGRVLVQFGDHAQFGSPEQTMVDEVRLLDILDRILGDAR